jgi:hypothetical protein
MPAPSYLSDRTGPAWLKGALDAPFFTACPEHSTGGFSHKTDRNFYCLDCHEDALCTFCVDRSHRGHDILQIRRASHNNAVRVNEIHQVNAEGVQQYTINGSKILFLKGRRPPQPWRGGYHFCEICGRSLLDAMRFCSLACKVAAVQESTDPLLSMQPGMSSKGLPSEAKHMASKRDQKKVKRDEKVKHSKRQFQLQREVAAAASKQEASWKAWREAAADDGEDKLREMIREVLDLVGFDEQASSKRKAEGEPEVVVIPKRRKRSNMGQPQVENRGSWEGAEKRDDSSSSFSVREEHASRSGGEHAGSSRFGLPSSSGRSYSQSDDDEATSIKWPGSGEGQARSGTHSTDSGIALSSSGMQEPEEVSMKPKGYSEGLVPLKKQKQGMEGNSSDNEHSCLSEPHSPVSVLRQRSGNFGQRVAALPPAIAF